MKSYVISLDTEEGRQRREKFNEQCRDAGIPVPEWVRGVNPKEDTVDQEGMTIGCRLTCSLGAIGCGMSHRNIYKKHLYDEHPVLVFEDDATLVNGFKRRLDDAMQQVPSDFDILFLGCQSSCGKESDPGIYPVATTHGTHAYVISPRGIQKMYEAKLNNHIDIMMGGMAREGVLRAYYIKPDISNANLDDMLTSSISPPRSFPNSITVLLNGMYNEKGLPVSRHYTGEMRRVGPVAINTYHLIFFVLGLILGHRWIVYMLCALDVALFEAKSAMNTVSTIFAYFAGSTVHSVALNAVKK